MNLTFADFNEGDSCSNRSFALASNSFSFITHPHLIVNSSFVRVAEASLIYFQNFTRHVVIEIESNNLDATVLPFAHTSTSPSAVIAKQPNSGCQVVREWNAYRCMKSSSARSRSRSLMLVVESMDSDSETRSIGPMCLSSNGVETESHNPVATANGTVKTLSTFYPLIRSGAQYNLTFAGMPPFHTRLHMLHAVAAEDSIILGIAYGNATERLDVYVDGALAPSSTLFTSYDSAGRLLLQRRDNISRPTLNSSVVPPSSSVVLNSSVAARSPMQLLV